jgi:predicted GIY-YIG superfamily endonuclease
MNGFIYKITNSINDKVYIGKTLSTIDKRFAEHKKDSNRT